MDTKANRCVKNCCADNSGKKSKLSGGYDNISALKKLWKKNSLETQVFQSWISDRHWTGMHEKYNRKLLSE